ncbi:MAG: 4a-hydroxytetrahydrobiopterin dehydratase [Patescibacteria group bacterium]
MWQEIDDKLYRKFTFKDFDEATEFMNKVAVIAGELNHHPTIQNTYNTVELWLSTHDAGDIITDKDRAFAKRIDELFVKPKKTASASLPKEIKMFADGGSRGNPGPSASGYVLMDMDDTVLVERGVYLGVTTNNQAEYQAVRFGLEDALRRGAREVEVYLDSLLVVNQMKGIFKVRNRDLWPIHAAIHELIKQYKKVTFTHVPRELNKLADAEVNKCLDAEASK